MNPKKLSISLIIACIILVSGCKTTGVTSTSSKQTTSSTTKVETTASSSDNKQQKEASPLSAAIKQTKNGFELNLNNQQFIMNSWEFPDYSQWLYTVRKIAEIQGKQKIYQMDALIVNPNKQKFHVIPLMQAKVKDDYSVDSLVGVKGFISEKEVLYLSVHNDKDSSVFYQIEKLDVTTGKKEVLFDHQPQNVSPDFFGRSWIDRIHHKLIVNSYKQAKLWVYDLKTKKVTLLDKRFKNYWPTFTISPSLSGETFWSGAALFDSSGHPLASGEHQGEEIGAGYSWSPNDTYTAYEYVYNDGPQTEISHEEIAVLAPQAIQIFDDKGQLIFQKKMSKASGKHVEINGWLNDDTAVFKIYGLGPSINGTRKKINAAYILVHVKEGKEQQLKQLALVTSLSSPQWIKNNNSVMAIDSSMNEIWVNDDEQTEFVGTYGKTAVWIVKDMAKAGAEIVLYNGDTKQIKKIPIHHDIFQPQLLANRWLSNNIIGNSIEFINLSELAQ